MPPGGGRVKPSRVLLGEEQQEVDRVGEAEPAELVGCRFGVEELPCLDRVLETRMR